MKDSTMENNKRVANMKGGKGGLGIFNSQEQKKFLSPVLKGVGQLAAGVASVSTAASTSGAATTASATGNPRNKCALQPGHSLMDWVRLGSSGKDLTGVGAKAGQMKISRRELATHSSPTDVWISINGKVYNVTSYLAFHPGGIDELMRGAGIDATALFNQIHPYVNYEQMLQKCLIGRLHNDVDNPETLFDGLDAPKSSELKETEEKRPLSPLMPRFNWIQTLKNVTLTFYTAPFSNPIAETRFTDDDCRKITILLIYSNVTYENEILLYGRVLNSWKCKINLETGKVDLILTKSESNIWENYGVMKQTSKDGTFGENKFEYKVVSKTNINYNTFLIELTRSDGSKCVTPIGKHVKVFGDIDGVPTARSYTPVSRIPLKVDRNSTSDDISLIIKRYPRGKISRMLCDCPVGHSVMVSRPLGDFALSMLDKREIVMMLAAGTGITPMLGLIDFLLERRIRKCQRLLLLFFNRTKPDILLFDQLECLRGTDSRFSVHYILSMPDRYWPGLTGHVTAQLIQQMSRDFTKGTTYLDRDLYFLVCGPDKFTVLTGTLLTDCGFQDDQCHLFHG